VKQIAAVAWTDDSPAVIGDRRFHTLNDGQRFLLHLQDVPIEFDLEHVRRERGELFGQLTVRTELMGARTYGDILNAGTLNLTSPAARKGRAALLAELSRASQIDWHRLLEEFACRVLDAEAAGQPSVRLKDVPQRSEPDHFDLDGVLVTRRSPSMLFGDAATGKSVWSLYQLGRLAQQGRRVALFDWELDADAHAKRLRALFPEALPDVRYVNCSRPLIYEIDRLRRVVADDRLEYAALDSVAPACHDEPSSADAATAFFRAVRQLGIGTLLVAHVPKSQVEQGYERPFGSQFWWALVRSAWFLVAQQGDGSRLITGFYHRKSNLSRLMPAIGFSITFGADRTVIGRCNLEEAPELAERMPLWQRIKDTLKANGPQAIPDLAERLNAKPDAIRKAVQRSTRTFTKVTADGTAKLALVSRLT